MLNLCLSFDYELFFGKNFLSDEEILFRPTGKIMEALKESGVSGTFFADVCSIEQHKKYGRTGYIEGFTEQIREMERQNLDVQLHIHPNWLCSEWVDGEWRFDLDSYRIHYFGFEKSKQINADSIIENGISYLNQALIPVNQDYKCCAYRAGGFSIQPHRDLAKLLYHHGILIDSSIAPHLRSTSQTNYYDFTNPPRRWNWWLSPEENWNHPGSMSSASLYEVPIGTSGKNPIQFLLARVFDKNSVNLPHGKRNGTYINEKDSAGNRNKIKSMLNYITSYNALSLDSYHYRFLLKQLEGIYTKYGCDKQEEYICLICHPKLATEESINSMIKLITILKEQNHKYAFFNMRELYDRLVSGNAGVQET